MYKAPSKRRQLIQRVAVYSAMTTAVIFLVTFLVFVMLGYRFNRDTSSIQQGGLVQFGSRPVDAQVTIGSARLADGTPSKVTINPGSYTVTMQKKGYKSWSKSVSVTAGEVLWLNYAQLVPTNVETESLLTLDQVTSLESSPNGQRIAYIGAADSPAVSLIDVSGDTPKRTSITLPVESLPVTESSVTYALVDWANDSDRFLVRASYDDQVDYIVIDRRDESRTVNISKSYERDITDIQFDPRSSERLYVVSSTGSVRSVNIAGRTISEIIATDVTSMQLAGSKAMLLVRSLPDAKQSINYMTFGDDEVRELQRIDSQDTVRVDLSEYFSETYVAVSVGQSVELFKLASLPSSDSDTPISLSSIYQTELPAPTSFLSLRSGGRFMFAQYEGGAHTFDIELKKPSITSFSSPVTGEIRWLDRYHFYLTNGKSLEVLEFDGANVQSITDLKTNFDAVQTNDGRYIYTIDQTESGFSLNRSTMILE